MDAQTFIVSDESVNSHGFIVKTDGIDLTQFLRNPIMYYMHEREKGVVGRWDNVRVQGTQLLMDAVFDESTDTGRQVKAQVEGGFLRCASIGVEIIEMEIINDVETVTACRLLEVSIVDIPANGNAVKLYDKRGKQIFNLAGFNNKDTDNDFRFSVISALGLDNKATDEEILDVIENLKNGKTSPEELVSQAVSKGLIDEADKRAFILMARKDIREFHDYIENKYLIQCKTLDNILKEAVRKGKMTVFDKPVFQRLVSVVGVSPISDIIDIIPERREFLKMIKGFDDNQSQNRGTWGLAEYRKYAPNELADNQSLYINLLEKEGKQVPLTPETLGYFRKNNPEYLRRHPDEYERVLEQLKNQ